MKKFFKALALVLALTLVVGVVPATAARAEVMKSKTLYIDGAQGTSEDGKACSVKAKKAIYKLAGFTKDEKDNHDLKAVSADKSIAKTTKNYVKAVAIGTTTVDIYDGDVKIGTTTIKVKKNASADTLVLKVDDGDVPEKLIAGAKYTFKLPRVGKDTDERRIFVNGTQLTDIKDKARQFEYTVTEADAKAGKITVKYESYQSKTYNAYTQTKTVEIPVTLGTMEKATQTVYNAFKLTFANEGTAKAAFDATQPSLSQGTAAVTENTEIIKVFQVGANGERIAAFIQALAIPTTAKNTINVTMFADLAEKATYEVVYGDVTLKFVAADWTPESIQGYEATYTPVDDGQNKGGTATLGAVAYSVGDQGQNVDITDKIADVGTFTFSDPNQSKNDYTKYSLNGDIVDFYVNDYTITAHVVLTYFGGTTATEFTNDFQVSSSDDRQFTVLYYLIDDTSSYNPNQKREAFISADDATRRLRVEIKQEIVINGVKVSAGDNVRGDNANVKFVTANTDKLAIETAGGNTYAPKAANAEVAVWVYYGDKVCDADPEKDGLQPIMVTVYDHKRLGTATITDATDGKIGFSTGASDINKTHYVAEGYDLDFENWKIVATDEQGRPYEDVTVIVKKLNNTGDAYTEVMGVALTNGIERSYLMSALNSQGTFGTRFLRFDARPGTTVTSPETIGYQVTVQDNNSTKKVVAKISFKAKNTSASEVTRYAVATNDTADTAQILGYDNAGYTVCIYDLANYATLDLYKASSDTTHLYLGFFKSTDGTETPSTQSDATTNAISLNNTIALNTVTQAAGGALTKLSGETLGIIGPTPAAIGVSSGAVGVSINRTLANKHIDNGTYAARAYKLDTSSSTHKVVGMATGNVTYSAPTWYKMNWTWKQAYTDKSSNDVLDVINEALRFNYVQCDRADGHITYSAPYAWVYNKTLSELLTAGVPISVSYTVKEDSSITILYVYIDEFALAVGAPAGQQLYVETPILRTIYTNVEK